MSITPQVKEYLSIVADKTGIPLKFLGAVLGAENGESILSSWPSSNDPAHLSDGPSRGGPAIEGIEPNGVNIYPSVAISAEAWAEYLNNPPPELHMNTVVFLEACKQQDFVIMATLWAQSDYASSHYYATAENPGGLVYNVLNDPAYAPLWEFKQESIPPVAVIPETPPSHAEGATLRVTAGMTLGGLAVAYHTSISAWIAANPVIKNPNLIEVGMLLQIPAPQLLSIRVASGATLDSLAIRYRTTIAELLKLNPAITDPNRIYIGETLRVPFVTNPS